MLSGKVNWIGGSGWEGWGGYRGEQVMSAGVLAMTGRRAAHLPRYDNDSRS